MAYPTFSPEWAVEDTYVDGVTQNKTRPDESLRDYGYTPNAKPTAQELNWQFNNLYLQIQELKTQLATPNQTPINELKLIVGDNRNPAIIYGYGTWVAYAQGRTLVGAGTGTDINSVQRSFAGGATGGEYSHTLSTSEMTPHVHPFKDAYHFENGGTLANAPASNKELVGALNGGFGVDGTDTDNNTLLFRNTITESTGGGQAFNLLNPYQVIYIWLRVS